MVLKIRKKRIEGGILNNYIEKNDMIIQNFSPIITLEDQYVQKIISIAQDIAKQNKPLSIKILYDKSNKILEIKRLKILNIIQYLVQNKILIEGSKHTRETVLSNSYRKKIYNTICRHRYSAG